MDSTSQKALFLDDLASLREWFKVTSGPLGSLVAKHGKIFCPSCGDFRSVDVSLLFEGPEIAKARQNRELRIARGNLGSLSSLPSGPAPDPGPVVPLPSPPALLSYVCRECGLHFTAVVYATAAGHDLLLIPFRAGGMRTQHTPQGVAFFLDQASRAESAGARSAAIAMYRGALEQLLFDQSYKSGMLGKKLEQLEADITGGTAPTWARDLDTVFLTALKDLGNSAIHPNGGDTLQQSLLDSELLARVKQVFLHLLDLAYEAPLRKAATLDALKKTAVSIKR